MRSTMWAVAIAAVLCGGAAAVIAADDIVTLKGTMTAVTRPMATLEADGRTYTLHLGPFWFWEKQGYRLEKGDAVVVTGLLAQEGERAHVYLRTMARAGEMYLFAEADGVPLWIRGSGSGRGPGGGSGPRGGPGMCPGRGQGGGPPDRAGAGRGCCPRCACPNCSTTD